MAKRLIKKFDGAAATVTWNSALCIHIAECGRAKGDLFEGGRKPWCDPDVSSDAEVLDIVKRCPSGSLSVEIKDATLQEQAAAENTITVVYNGPLFIKGKLEIEGAPDDAPGLNFRAALCRCGLSKNKPYCDNSHEKGGFKDFGAVGDTGSLDDPEYDGGNITEPLKITFVDNGPIRLSGDATVLASSGRPAWRGNKTALCRCGLSKNKPFCDGAHRAAEWTSD